MGRAWEVCLRCEEVASCAAGPPRGHLASHFFHEAPRLSGICPRACGFEWPICLGQSQHNPKHSLLGFSSCFAVRRKAYIVGAPQEAHRSFGSLARSPPPPETLEQHPKLNKKARPPAWGLARPSGGPQTIPKPRPRLWGSWRTGRQ